MGHKQTPAAVYTARIPLAEGEADLVVTPAFLLNGDKVVKQILSGAVQMGSVIDEIRTLLIHHAGEEEGARITAALDGTSTDGLASFVNAWITTTSSDSKYVEKHLVTDEDIAAEFFGLATLEDEPDTPAAADADADADAEPGMRVLSDDEIAGWRVDGDAGVLVAYDEDGEDGQSVAPEDFDVEAQGRILNLTEEEIEALRRLMSGLVRAREIEAQVASPEGLSGLAGDTMPQMVLAMAKAAALYPEEAPFLPPSVEVEALLQKGLISEDEAATIMTEALRRKANSVSLRYPSHEDAAEAMQQWMRSKADLWPMAARAALLDLDLPEHMVDAIMAEQMGPGEPEDASAGSSAGTETETVVCSYCFREVEVEGGRMLAHAEDPIVDPYAACQGSNRRPKKPKGGLWFR